MAAYQRPMTSHPSRRLTTWDRIILVATALPLLVILMIGPAVRSGAIEVPSESYCLSVRWFGAECPGCGLTRSLVLLSRGDLGGSVAMNPMGFAFTAWLLALFAARPAKIQIASIGSLVRYDLGVTVALLLTALLRVVLFYAGPA